MLVVLGKVRSALITGIRTVSGEIKQQELFPLLVCRHKPLVN